MCITIFTGTNKVVCRSSTQNREQRAKAKKINTRTHINKWINKYNKNIIIIKKHSTLKYFLFIWINRWQNRSGQGNGEQLSRTKKQWAWRKTETERVREVTSLLISHCGVRGYGIFARSDWLPKPGISTVYLLVCKTQWTRARAITFPAESWADKMHFFYRWLFTGFRV